jgi:hypothetical protein
MTTACIARPHQPAAGLPPPRETWVAVGRVGRSRAAGMCTLDDSGSAHPDTGAPPR